MYAVILNCRCCLADRRVHRGGRAFIFRRGRLCLLFTQFAAVLRPGSHLESSPWHGSCPRCRGAIMGPAPALPGAYLKLHELKGKKNEKISPISGFYSFVCFGT